MLMVLNQNCPYFRARLTPTERARDELVFAAYDQLWHDHGIACVVAGYDFEPLDYIDRTHLSPSGGRKLAALVAREVKKFGRP